MGDFPNKDQAYYGYYAQFIHQQNMLQDTVRTNSYHKAIIGNQNLFLNKKVLDVGAGSGILSYFAVQAGASEVYAVEASNMANQIKKILAHNPHLASIMSIFHQSIEKPLPIPKVHTIISEPIGVLIVHERMIESYLHARDNYLAPGGVMIPSSGSIYLAPFSDSVLWAQTNSKVRFWEQDNFFGVDFSCLAKDAHAEIFGQPIVGCFDSRLLMAPSVSFAIDFETISLENLKTFQIPISWTLPYTGLIHGIAGWFDINLAGLILSTSPTAEKTHWQQIRFLFQEPIAVNAMEVLNGVMNFKVNDSRSYDITVELFGDNDGGDDRMADFKYRKGSWKLHEQTYYYDQGPIDLTKPEFNSMYTPHY